jgi:hypothetical protein
LAAGDIRFPGRRERTKPALCDGLAPVALMGRTGAAVLWRRRPVASPAGGVARGHGRWSWSAWWGRRSGRCARLISSWPRRRLCPWLWPVTRPGSCRQACAGVDVWANRHAGALRRWMHRDLSRDAGNTARAVVRPEHTVPVRQPGRPDRAMQDLAPA